MLLLEWHCLAFKTKLVFYWTHLCHDNQLMGLESIDVWPYYLDDEPFGWQKLTADTASTVHNVYGDRSSAKGFQQNLYSFQL